VRLLFYFLVSGIVTEWSLSWPLGSLTCRPGCHGLVCFLRFGFPSSDFWLPPSRVPSRPMILVPAIAVSSPCHPLFWEFLLKSATVVFILFPPCVFSLSRSTVLWLPLTRRLFSSRQLCISFTQSMLPIIGSYDLKRI
jgi:hypothetical protein